jgi:hypothetical protein
LCLANFVHVDFDFTHRRALHLSRFYSPASRFVQLYHPPSINYFDSQINHTTKHAHNHDMASDPTNGALPSPLSDDERENPEELGPVDDGETNTPRETVEENGLDEDDDDLFGDGAEDEEPEPV